MRRESHPEMLNGGSALIAVLLLHAILQPTPAASFPVPTSNCYTFDNTSHLHDFTSWIGHHLEHEGKDYDTVLRFCKDVESRSQKGYIDFGRFDTLNDFVTGSGRIDFVQGFYSGDLMGCEQTYDKLGRTAQANIICGNCLNGQCTGDLGCICNVTYDSACSFGTEQTRVSLYMTAVSSVSNLVGKPTFKVNPSKGLEIKLSGSGADGSPPTTLSPTMLDVDWTCEIARDIPYEVLISIPVEGYEPIEFTLTKNCKNKQNRKEDATVGWATFGVLSCIFTVVSTLFCCGGFIYNTRVRHQHGLDAVPGMTILSACLETVTGGGGGYSRVEDLNSAFVNQASWERQPVSSQSSHRTSERKYGAI